MLRRISDPERGASFAEYAAVILLVAAIVGVVIASGVSERIATGITDAVDQALNPEQGAPVADGPGDESEDAPGADPDIGRDPPTYPGEPADLDVPEADPAEPEIDPDSTWPYMATTPVLLPGPEEERDPCNPLCRPGESDGDPFSGLPRDMHPEVDLALESREQYGAEEEVPGYKCTGRAPMHRLCQVRKEALMAAMGGEYVRGYPDAAEYLRHFLRGSGETMTVDMDRFMDDVPEFDEQVRGHQQELGIEAVQQAQALDTDGPVTFPVNTAWNAWGYPPDAIDGASFVYDDANWANAIGSFNYNLVGEVTAYPPEEPGGEWSYEIDTQVNLRKYYDWGRQDTSPAVNFPGFTFSQQELWELHRHGMAQEFWIAGDTRVSSEGSG
ncbi:Flp pilus assembly pilin Flp [Spinactinospora alkalitolerans]|uniref:Flp pilus assembly pilin Flp n=1 Tax=Spinactinospora alkalitolerans TaxID=687207 RepID=A0A852U0J5_9ACTN|nr:hypothetical protein [Spinactinospora alkalitolerans]NYE49718.1 Flp pilus assembly pilin Flp [Spinactinospora alkalitolerans]